MRAKILAATLVIVLIGGAILVRKWRDARPSIPVPVGQSRLSKPTPQDGASNKPTQKLENVQTNIQQVAVAAVDTSPSEVPKDKLVEGLRGLLIPSSSVASKFTTADEGILLEAYRKTPKLSERSALVWILAKVGGDETAKAFIFTLAEEFKGAKLVADEGGSLGSEEAVMQTIAGCLGLLASRSDIAWDFLKEATEPKFWQRTIGWNSSTGREIFGLMAASAIQSVGMANRDGVREMLQRFKEGAPSDIAGPRSARRVFDGDVVQAAFYADLRQEQGEENFYRWLLDMPRDQFDADGAYSRWKTGKGAAWQAWYDTRLAAENR